ncbi:MAG: LLM class flavin-dependent oxidoreductase [Dehalococcoidia bacterium]|jgi:alkanesulfonate monooxygenase SsuD/methylene tetrahydromethanopterin reductase-like flavin-dependent oxidoreductase (luciferase family)|nr:LLM class flavin-dependent oxidoreductase [Dehalococcoidia bacterium]
MRFGILLSVPYPGDFDSVQMYQHICQQARVASESNFEALFAAQHYLIGPTAAMVQPLLLLSHLAAQAPGMYLGTSVFLLPFQHPVAVAEQTATLDVLSGGKFLFGVGQGYRDEEFQSFGQEKGQRRQRMVEGLQVIRKLWAEDNVTFRGRFCQLDGVSIAPKPLQMPGPPILIGADTLRSISRVPEVGDHWIASRRHTKSFLRQAVPAYQAALERQEREFKGMFIFRDLCVAGSAGEAEDRIKDAYERMYQMYQRWGQPGERYDLSFDELKQERLIAGSPDEVAEQVMAYHQEFGAEFMWFTVYWPGMDPQRALETIRLFGERVIPAIKRATPACPLP